MTRSNYRWPNIESPEAAAIWAADPFIGIEQALQVALDAENAGLDFYAGVLAAMDAPRSRCWPGSLSRKRPSTWPTSSVGYSCT
jgi:hypothetical protein